MKNNNLFYSGLLFILIVFALNVKLEGQERVIELNTQITSNQDRVARDAIILHPGFSTGSFEFSATVNEDLICDVDYLSGTSIPDADNRNIDISLPVGSTPGSFGVSPSGAATYTIPITVPPGTAGVRPSVSVTYNSQGGNGIMGMGWNLSGISAITRVPSSIYHDGANNVDGVDFDAMDRFALDGNRLIKTSGTYGAANSKYKTEVTDFSEITAYGAAGNGPSYFKLITKDKKTLEFGNTADSKIEAEGKTDVLIWYLNKVTDTKGNYIKYEYYENNGTGEFYPKKISYTGTSSYSPYNTIEFFYEDRTDKNKAYVGGAEVNQNVLLYRIKVTAHGNIVKNYYFEYRKDTYSKLVKIRESDKEGNEFNATVFEWGTENNSSTYLQNLGGDNYYFQTGDYNGDGRQDLLKFPKKDNFDLDDDWEVYLSNTSGISFTKPANGEGYLVDPLAYPIGGYLSPNGSYASYLNYLGASGAATSDLNGDGIDDFIRTAFVPKGFNVEALDDIWIIYPMYSTASSSGDYYFNYGSPVHFHNYEPQIFLGDFDGDNVTEIITYQDEDGAKVWKLTDLTQNYEPKTLPYTGSISSSDKVLTGDMDGDGKMELFIFRPTLINIYSYDGTTLVSSTATGPSSLNSIFLADYNGDGKSDALTYSESNQWKIYFFNGKNFEASMVSPLLEDYDPADTDDNHNIYLGDFNRDGKSDIMQTNKSGSNVAVKYCFFNGSGFNYGTKTFPDNNAYSHYFTIGDFNGDGQSDLIYYSNDDSRHKTIVDNPNGTDKLIKKFTNGLNLTTEVNYGVLPNSSYYDAGTYQGNARVMGYKGPLYFVTMAYAKDLIKEQIHYTKTWHYDNALLHRQGKGFLGFMEVEEDNITRLSEIRTTYNYDTDYYNVFPEKITTKYRYKILSETTNTYNKLEPYTGLKIIFPYVEQQISVDKLKNVTITTNNSYGTNGNLSTVTVNHNNEGTTTTVYEGYTTHGKPQTIRATKKRGSDSHTRDKSLTYDSYGLLATETTDPSKANWVKNTYSRDNYGNITQVKTESPGLGTRTSTNTYDSKHQFIITKTNAESHSENFTYDPAYGNLLAHTDANGLTSGYVYDGFGRLTKTTLPSGKVINSTLHWNNNNSDFSKVIYYSKTSSTGSPESRAYTDQLGRTWLEEYQGYNGSFVRTENNYNPYNQLSGKTLPYYQGGTKTWESYSYTYADGRLNTVTLGSDVKTYSYTGSKVKVTDAGGNEFEKEYNAYGQLASVADEGGTVNYTYYGHGGVKTIVSNGAAYTVEYDEYERQKKLIDPDAGTINYVYNAYDELEEQTDAAGNKFIFTYDGLGRVLTKTNEGGDVVAYVYDTGTNGIGLLASVSSTNGTATSYAYDGLSRVKEVTRDISGDTYYNGLAFRYEYNASGDVTKITYPSGFPVINSYNSYGYLTNVKRGDNNADIWSLPTYNAMGQITSYKQGNNITTTRGYTAYGLPNRIQAGTIQDSEYSFNQANGTLTWRKNHKHKNGSNESFTETFGYDGLYRLTGITPNNGTATINMSYNGSIGASNGTIASKSDMGTFNYTGTRPHALTDVVLNEDNEMFGEGMLSDVVDIEYTPFKKIKKIKLVPNIGGPYTDYELTVNYGPLENRQKTVFKNLDIVKETKYFAGDYEIIIDGTGNVRKLHYIYADPGLVCVMEQQGSTKSMNYIHTDYLGSIEYITNSSGTVEQELSYDAWGRLRNPSDWGYSSVPSPKFGRGFTTHEHLEKFSLINMNGRVYDPRIGSFLSPDNYVQAPDYTQNFNRYGYAFNNPLMYSDPDGEWIIPLLTTLGGAYLGGMQANNFELNPGNWNWNSPGTWIGMVQGGIGGYGIGQGIQNRIDYKNSFTSFYDTPYGYPAEFDYMPIEGRGYGMSFDNSEIPQDIFYKSEIWADFEKISYGDASWGERNSQILKAMRYGDANYSDAFKMSDIFNGYFRKGDGTSVGYKSPLALTEVGGKKILLSLDLSEYAKGLYQFSGTPHNWPFPAKYNGKLAYQYKYSNNYGLLLTIWDVNDKIDWSKFYHVYYYINNK